SSSTSSFTAISRLRAGSASSSSKPRCAVRISSAIALVSLETKKLPASAVTSASHNSSMSSLPVRSAIHAARSMTSRGMMSGSTTARTRSVLLIVIFPVFGAGYPDSTAASLEQRFQPLDVEVRGILRHFEGENPFQRGRQLAAHEAQDGGLRHQHELLEPPGGVGLAEVVGNLVREILQFVLLGAFLRRHRVAPPAETVIGPAGAIGVPVLHLQCRAGAFQQFQ